MRSNKAKSLRRGHCNASDCVRELKSLAAYRFRRISFALLPPEERMLWFGVSFRILFGDIYKSMGFCSGWHRGIPGPLGMSCFPPGDRFIKKQVLSSASSVQDTELSFMLSVMRWNRPLFCETVTTQRRSVPLRNQE